MSALLELPILLEDTLLSTLNTLAVTITPHHNGKGMHILVNFSNGHNASITTNTCHTDLDDTYEIMASAYRPEDNVEDTLCHANLATTIATLTYINDIKD